MSKLTGRGETKLLALVPTDRVARNWRRDAQIMIDLEATDAAASAARIQRFQRRPDPTDDKINEAFKRATGC